jgi:hypothetical protein
MMMMTIDRTYKDHPNAPAKGRFGFTHEDSRPARHCDMTLEMFERIMTETPRPIRPVFKGLAKR